MKLGIFSKKREIVHFPHELGWSLEMCYDWKSEYSKLVNVTSSENFLVVWQMDRCSSGASRGSTHWT